MKTLHKNKLLVVLFGLFMALCAVLGILSTVPRLASAGEAGFDWSKYDDPANYTETVVYEKSIDSMNPLLLGQFHNKVFRMYGIFDDTSEAYAIPSLYLTFGDNVLSAKLDVSYTGCSVEAWKNGELYSNTDMFSQIDYRIATDNTYIDFYIEDTDVLMFSTEEIDIDSFEWLNPYEYTQKISILELDEVEPLPEVTEDSNFLDDVATWFNDNLGVSFTSAGVVFAIIIFVILIKKK